MKLTIPYVGFVGIDVGSMELVVFIRDVVQQLSVDDVDRSQEVEHYVQSKKGYRTLARALRQYARKHKITSDDILITMEATGNYWLPPASYLYRDGFDIMVINPSSARHYAGMKLKRSKSDPIDARLLSSLGMIYAVDDHINIRLWEEPPVIYDELHQRVKLFSELSKVVTQTSNRQHARSWRNVKVDDVESREKDVITYLKTHKGELNREIEYLLLSQTEWQRPAEILRSIPGFGAIVSAYLLIVTQNFTLFDTCEQLQSYCGLVPREYSSGTLQKHKRIGHAGNQTMRSLLFLAATTAAYRDKRLRAYKERLTKENPDKKRLEKEIRANRGKASTVAHIAVARKLVAIAWACIHNDTLYDPNYEAHRSV